MCGLAVLLAHVAWEEEALFSRSRAVIFGLVAVLFNPIIPVYLKRTIWFDIDVGMAIILASHLVCVRLSWWTKPS